MKSLSVVGIALILVGLAALAFGRFSYTTREKVVDIGPVTASVDEQHSVAIPDIAGIAALVAGAAMLIASRRRA